MTLASHDISNDTGTAVQALGAALREAGRQGNDLERSLAVRAIRLTDPKTALAVAQDLLVDEDEDVRADAATLLTALADPECESALLSSLIEDPCVDVKAEAIRGLGAIKSESAVATLSALVRGRTDRIVWDEEELAAGEFDDWTELQRLAIESLGKIGAPEAAGPIIAAMTDEFGQDLWIEGLAALVRLGPVGHAYVLEQLGGGSERVRRLAAQTLTRAEGALDRPVLEHLARNDAREVRLIAAKAISATESDLVRDLGADADAEVRATILARFHAGDASRLADAIADPAPTVRACALRALADKPNALSPDGATRLMERFLEEDDNGLTLAVIDVASRLAPRWAPGQHRALAAKRGAHPEVRRTAITWLAQAPSERTLGVLRSLIGDPLRPIRLAALQALSTIATSDGGSAEHRDEARTILIDACRGKLFAKPEAPSRSELTKADPAAEAGEQRRGKSAAADDDAGRRNPIRIDRDGNIVPISEGENEPAEAALSDGGATEADGKFPTSTLDSIQGLGVTDPLPPPEHVELTPEDMSFLEMAQGRAGKRTLPVESRIPVHVDAQLLGCKLLGQLPHPDAIATVVGTLATTDAALRQAAARALYDMSCAAPEACLAHLRDIGRYIADPTPLVRLDLARCLANLGPDAASILTHQLNDDDPVVVAEAVTAISKTESNFDPRSYLAHASQIVRLAAARALWARDPESAGSDVIAHAFSREGEDAYQVFHMIHGTDADAAFAAWVPELSMDGDPRRRMIALKVISRAAEQMATRADPNPSAATTG